MGKQGRGHVVTITTSLVDQPMSSVPAVLASLTKGALSAATRSLAIEYAKTGVRINAVSPGIIKTPMHPPEAHQALAALHPMGRMGNVSDVVDAILYLDSAEFVTGEIFTSTEDKLRATTWCRALNARPTRLPGRAYRSNGRSMTIHWRAAASGAKRPLMIKWLKVRWPCDDSAIQSRSYEFTVHQNDAHDRAYLCNSRHCASVPTLL